MILLLCSASLTAQQLSGSWNTVTTSAGTTGTMGFRAWNPNTGGKAGVYGLVNNGVGGYHQFSLRVLETGNTSLETTGDFYVNGVLYGGGGGSGLWSPGTGSKIYYNSGFVGIGTNNPPYPFTIKHNTDLSADRVFHLENASGTAKFSVFADNKFAYEAQQPALWLNALTATDSVRGSVIFKFQNSLDLATMTLYNNDLRMAVATGDFVVGSRKLLIDNGSFEIKATDSKATWMIANDFYGGLRVGNTSTVTNAATLNVVPTIGKGHRVGASIVMNSEGVGGNTFAGVFTNNFANSGFRNFGVKIDARNSSGTEYPLVIIDENVASEESAGFLGAQLFVDEVTADGASFSIHPRGIAQIQSTYNSAGAWSFGLSVENTFYGLMDSVIAKGATYNTGVSAQLLRLWTHSQAAGTLTYNGWNTAVVVVECSASIKTTISSNDPDPTIAVGISKNGTTSTPSIRDYTLRSTDGIAQVSSRLVVSVVNNDVIKFTIATRADQATGSAQPRITVYGSRCEITTQR